MSEFQKDQLDVLVLAKPEQCEVQGEPIRGGKRERQFFDYVFDGHRTCEKVWRYIHNLGEKRFKNLKAHYKTHGVVPRDHGRQGKRPVNAYSFEVVHDAVKFLLRYADDNGLPMPAAPHGRDGRPPVYLPSCDTKADVYKKYVNACKVCQPAKQSVGETTFRNIWKLCVPHIRRMEPRTDVCAKCEHFRNEIQFATTEEDKLNSSIAFSGHILKAQKEREFLNSCIQRAQNEVTDITVQPPCSPCSLDLHNVHYTFDFAQFSVTSSVSSS